MLPMSLSCGSILCEAASSAHPTVTFSRDHGMQLLGSHSCWFEGFCRSPGYITKKHG